MSHTDLDVLFVCDAHAQTGLGHGSRCAHIAQLLLRANPKLKMGFQGTFSDGARTYMSEVAPGVAFFSPQDDVCGQSAFVDRMADIQDPEAWSQDVVMRLMQTCERVVYMASGTTLPPVPQGVICIGYQPSNIASRPPHIYWGLEYAPTRVAPETEQDNDLQREPGRALVALGGARDDKPLRLILEALSTIDAVTDIDVLTSPVNAPADGGYVVGCHQTLHYRDGGHGITEMLQRAGLVIASFGNLGYEALAAGAPLCLVGQKVFQAQLSDLLAQRGLAVSAGLVEQKDVRDMAQAIDETVRNAQSLHTQARRQIDGKGLWRIAQIIAPDEMARDACA